MPLNKVSIDLKQPTNSSVEQGLTAHPMADFFSLKFGRIWSYFRKEHISYWAVCAYLFFEYVRPQSIFRQIDIIPWSKLFVGVAIASCIAQKGWSWRANPLNKWIILYGLVIVLSSFMAFRSDVAFSHLMDYFGWLLAYFIIVNIVTTERRLFVFLLIFLIASYKLSFHGARTWALRGFAFTSWGLMGPEGPFQNSGEFAVQMLMMMPIAYRLIVSIRPWLTRMKYWIALGAPITAALTVAGASSRGGQIGLVFQAYLTFLRGRLSLKTISVAALAIFALYSLIPTEQMQRFRAMGSDDNSRQRLIYWKRGMQMVEEHPLLGVGFYNFPIYFDNHYSSDISGKAELPHNIFVQVGTDAGILGLFTYTMLILGGFGATRSIRRNLKNDASHWLYNLSYGYDAAFMGFLIAGQFVTIGYYPFMWINLSFIAATRGIVDRMTVSKQYKSVVPHNK